MSEEIKVSNMFIDSLKTQEEIYYKAKMKELYEVKIKDLQEKVEQLENINDKISSALNSGEKEIDRLNNIINELEKYIHNELVLDFYNDDMPCELIINKMEKMIKELKEDK